MKERVFFDDEFEKHLKEKADQFKMYPSDKVWNQVHSSLHTRRRRFVAGMTFLIGTILILAGSQLIFPPGNIHPQTIAAKTDAPAKPAETADVQGFTPDNFVMQALMKIHSEPHPADRSLNTAAPSLLLLSGVSSNPEPGTGDIPGNPSLKN